MILRTTLKGLDPKTILHPDDKSTMDTLRKIPGFKTAVDKTVVNIMEKYATIEYTADGINVNQQSMPTVYQQLREACRILDIKKIPDCWIVLRIGFITSVLLRSESKNQELFYNQELLISWITMKCYLCSAMSWGILNVGIRPTTCSLKPCICQWQIRI